MTNNDIYQIKISLKDFTPKIWRRVLISANTELCELHDIIQLTMGWENAHLHHFLKDKVYYLEELDSDFNSENDVAYGDMTVADLLTAEKDKMEYEYDFGDSWKHEVLLEKILEADPAMEYPVCIGGKNSCPPEDCGGVYGYEHLLEVIKNPKSPEYDDMIDWVGDDFDPKHFDLEEVNKILF